jgi:hypothetical protein
VINDRRRVDRHIRRPDLKRIRSLRTVAAGHAFVQNLRRGHYAIIHIRLLAPSLVLQLAPPCVVAVLLAAAGIPAGREPSRPRSQVVPGTVSWM